MDNNSFDPTKPLSDADMQKQANSTRSPMFRETSWKPGQSGNPNGRPPKGYSITDVFRKMFDENPEKKIALANKILLSALAGDNIAAKLIWQYMDGMPAQSVDLTSKGEQIKTPIHYVPHEVDEEPNK